MERDHSIDILRFFGISLIILAHTDCPFVIKQLRMFDVPLMVFISGLSYSGKIIESVKGFYCKRIKRLLIPVWAFIPIYMIPLAIMQWLGVMRTGFTWQGFLGSFVFYGEGMGYIWIYKVFLIIMLCTPFLIKIDSVIRNDILYIAVLFFFIFIQQILIFIYFRFDHFVFRDILGTYGLYVFGYVPLFMLGLRIRCSKRKRLAFFLSVLLIVFLLTATLYYKKEGLPFQLTSYKYPPQFYFIIYGCTISVILWCLKGILTPVFDNKLFVYIGRNSDWVYLWHAFFVLYVRTFVHSWVIQYLLIYVLGVGVCVLQKMIVTRINSSFLKKYF